MSDIVSIIEKLEKYKPYPESVKISDCETIVNGDLFVDTQTNIAKTSKSQKLRNLAIGRLVLFGIALKQQRNSTKPAL